MNNLNDSSNTSNASNTLNDSSNIDLKDGLMFREIFIARPITIPPERMFEMTFPHLAKIYFGIKDKLTKRKDNPKQK